MLMRIPTNQRNNTSQQKERAMSYSLKYVIYTVKYETKYGESYHVFADPEEQVAFQLEIARAYYLDWCDEPDKIGEEGPDPDAIEAAAYEWCEFTGYSEDMRCDSFIVEFPVSSLYHVLYERKSDNILEIYTVGRPSEAPRIALMILQRERDRIGFPKEVPLQEVWEQISEITEHDERLVILPAGDVGGLYAPHRTPSRSRF